MIEYFTITNFMSYRDETELSFVASKKDAGKESPDISWYKEIDGKRLLRLIVGLGLNGTGKTKMIDALNYFRMLATRKPEKPSDLPAYRPFLLDTTSMNEPTEMRLSYYIDDINYLYYIKVSQLRIEEEELRLLGGRSQRVFHRLYNPKTDTVVVNFGQACDLSHADEHTLEVNTVNNTTVLCQFGTMNLDSRILKINYDYFENHISKVHKSDQNLAEKLSTGDANRDQNMKRMLLQLLRDVGSNIIDYHVDASSINIEDIIKSGAPQFVVNALREQYPTGQIDNKVLRFEHSTTHGPSSLDSSMESLGTINIVKLLIVLYDIVIGKKCTCIDELGSGIHSTALEFILRMYLKLNGDSQIFVATHDLSILQSKYLRRDALRLFYKNEDGVTSVRRQEYVHNTINLYKKYTNEISEQVDRVMEDEESFNEYKKSVGTDQL